MTRTRIFHGAVYLSLPIMVVAGLAAMFIFASGARNETPQVSKSAVSTTTTTTTAKPGKVAGVDTTTTAAPTTTKAQPKATNATTTTITFPAFRVTVSAEKSSQNIDFCDGSSFTFTPSVKAIRTGSATYRWIRSDNVDTGAEGSISFGADGNPTATIPNFTLETPPGAVTPGWVEFIVTHDDGTQSSGHIEYGNGVNPSSLTPTGC